MRVFKNYQEPALIQFGKVICKRIVWIMTVLYWVLKRIIFLQKKIGRKDVFKFSPKETIQFSTAEKNGFWGVWIGIAIFIFFRWSSGHKRRNLILILWGWRGIYQTLRIYKDGWKGSSSTEDVKCPKWKGCERYFIEGKNNYVHRNCNHGTFSQKAKLLSIIAFNDEGKYMHDIEIKQ